MAAAKKRNDIPPEKVEAYERIVATQPETPLKGASVPYTSVNGHMSSYLDATGAMALRLPAGDREAFLEKYETKHFDAYGVVQKEYVKVPDRLLQNTAELEPYFKTSYQYVAGLKPKPAKKTTK